MNTIYGNIYLREKGDRMKKLTLVFIISLFVSSCNLFNFGSDTQYFFPLAVGNKWVHTDLYDVKHPGVYTKTIQGTMAHNNKDYFLVEHRDSVYSYIDSTYVIGYDTSYYREEDGKVYSLWPKETQNPEYYETLFLDCNVEAGDSYIYNYTGMEKPYDVGYMNVTLKTKRLMQVYYDIPGLADVEYSMQFREGVGLVEYRGAWSSRKLVSYDIN